MSSLYLFFRISGLKAILEMCIRDRFYSTLNDDTDNPKQDTDLTDSDMALLELIKSCLLYTSSVHMHIYSSISNQGENSNHLTGG